MLGGQRADGQVGTVLVGLDPGVDPNYLVRVQTPAAWNIASSQMDTRTALTPQELLDCCFHTVA
jgi:hypothetical protein